MRKLYVLLACCLAIFFAKAQTPNQVNFSFSADPITNNVAFSNTSVLQTDGVRKAFWYFGDGSFAVTAPLAGTSHHYSNSGTYQVCLKIWKYSNTNDSVLLGSECKSVTIQQHCTAGFQWVDSVTTNPFAHQVSFFGSGSNNSNKPVTEVCWNFGDGTDTCIQASLGITPPLNIRHKYSTNGTYTACIRIKYDGGCVAEKCNTIVLGTTNIPDSCRADFTVQPTTSGSSFTRKFFAQPWHNKNKKPVRICWSFGDGKDTCIQYSNSYSGDFWVEHKYQQAGQYNVCVKINYDGGCESSTCRLINIPPVQNADSCSANFTVVPNTIPFSLEKKFIAQPWHNNNKKPVRICWSFGDNKDTCIQYATSYTGVYFVEHRYSQPGRYNVCVRIKYDGGCESQKCDTIGIPSIQIPDSCSANFTTASATIPSLVKKFVAQPWHSLNKKPVRICWTFGDNTDTCIQYPANYTGDYFVEHRYAQPGQYEVCVNIKYDGGCEKRKCNIITVPPVSQECSFDLSEVAVSNTSLERKFYVGLMQNRKAEKVCWNFGDGTDTCVILADPLNPQQLIITHRYTAPGTYTVCAKVYYVGGCIVQKCKTISIAVANPNVCGGYMTDSAASANTIRFKGTGIHAPNDFVTAYRWTFGDGTGATGQVVNHTYAAPGRYNVCLVIVTNLGCETKICKTVSVAGNNQPQLVLTPNPVINVLNASFISLFQQTVTVRIYNANGLMVKSYVRNANVGVNTWTFTDVATLPTGVYSVIVQSSNQFATAIFFKQ